ncbi:hypothetical protein OAG68_01720 [bacterium]|nr:hypothetical protein [bacterium]
MQKFWLFAGAMAIGAGVLVWGAQQGWFDGGHQPVSIAEKPVEAVAKPLSDDEALAELAGLLDIKKGDFAKVGEIDRPKRDLAFDAPSSGAKRPAKGVLPNPGRAPFLKGNENSQVAGLMAELNNQDKEKQEETRVAKSTFFLPEPFDQEKYDADPQAYLNKIRPGRVFQSAQPGPDVNRLTSISDSFVSVLQGESVQLKVKAEPGAPVAFYTPEIGTFENQLKSITVAADKEGVATAKFTLGRGSSGLVNVLAASPVNSDHAKFTFRVSLPAQQ